MAAPPYRYQIGLRWTAGKKGALSAPPRPELIGGAPTEFGGDEQAWSPEHLLLSSLSLCLMLTFIALAEKAKLQVDAYRCETEGTLDKAGGVVAFTAITVRVRLRSPEQQRAETMLQTAKKYCFISNSLKAAVAVEAMPAA